MIAWLVSPLERLPPAVGRAAVAVVALLLLGAVAAIVIITPPSEVAPRSQRPPARPPSGRTAASPGEETLPSPVTAGQLVQARRVAERFLASYLRFAYGRARVGSVRAVTLSCGASCCASALRSRRSRPNAGGLRELEHQPRLPAAEAIRGARERVRVATQLRQADRAGS
jgi:hypothetical protein